MNRRTRPANPASTTARFTEDAAYEDAETAFLLLANIEHVRQCLLNKLPDDATTLMRRLDENFHEICNRLPQFRDMWDIISAEQSDPGSMHSVLVTQCSGYTGIVGAACTDDPIDEGGWRPANSAFHGASAKPLPGDHQSFSIQTASANGYWHTDKFIADSPNGNITVCFDAKNTEKPSQHRSWIFENGGYRVGGEFVALTEWQNFCVPILTRPNCILEFQIDQQEDDQWLMIRNFHILGAADLAFKERDTLTIPVSEWTSVGVEDAGAEMPSNYGDNCRQWRIVGDNPFLHSPILPKPGKAGLLFHFEARCDQASSEFSQCYIIQGPGQHRLIGHCAFDESWQQYRLFLEDETSSQAKVQIDCPKDVGTFAIRNVNVTPVDWDNS